MGGTVALQEVGPDSRKWAGPEPWQGGASLTTGALRQVASQQVEIPRFLQQLGDRRVIVRAHGGLEELSEQLRVPQAHMTLQCLVRHVEALWAG